MNPDKRAELYRRLQAANPKPTTELEYQTPYELLVSVTLSAQATDKSVNAATDKLFPVARTPAAMLKLGEAGLKPYIKTIGLYNTKARNILAAAKMLLELHGGEVPRDRAALEALPGVGRKTANVVLNTAFEPTIAVDTHIFRVGNRTGLAPGKGVRAVEDKLLKFTPDEYKQDAHHWLILHGRYVCKARKPECPRCVIADLCEYRHKTQAEPKVPLAPNKKPAKKRKRWKSASMYSSNRNDTRQAFFDAWKKLQDGAPLTALETVIAEVIKLHPEYHRYLEGSSDSLDKDWLPEGGETNPFLHLGLHVAIREQLSIDRPAGIKAAYEVLLRKTGDVMQTEHLMLECLGEALWRAQRENRLPDEQAYLACIRSRAEMR